MALEIERKFLLDGIPERPASSWDRPSYDRAYCIRQGWIGRLRLRKTISFGADHDRHHACVKFGRGLVRREFELSIPSFLFVLLWPLTRGRRVEKYRYEVDVDSLTFQVDNFCTIEGLFLCEVELASPDARCDLPEWIRERVIREVTSDPRYTNKSLAR